MQAINVRLRRRVLAKTLASFDPQKLSENHHELAQMESVSTYFAPEIIAALAVVISLIHLGIQVRQSRIQSIKDSTDAITRERAEFVKLLATESELSEIIARGLAGSSKSTPKDYFRFTSYLYYLFVQLELGFRKWKRGQVDGELWRAWNEGVKWWMRCPGTRAWWLNNPAGGFTKEFKEYIDQTMESIISEPPDVFEKQLEFLGQVGEKKEA